MYLNLGAAPPPSTLTVTRGHSSATSPITEPSWRVYQRRHVETTHDLTGLKLLPWSLVQKKLMELNPRLLFRPSPGKDGRIIIGLDRPSPGAIADYESLSYYDRKELDAPGTRETPGPRVWVVMASSNSVEPYVELVDGTPGHIHRPIARSLVTICRALVREGAFTWDAAERAFGMPLRAATVTRKYVSMTTAEFAARNDALITIGG